MGQRRPPTRKPSGASKRRSAGGRVEARSRVQSRSEISQAQLRTMATRELLRRAALATPLLGGILILGLLAISVAKDPRRPDTVVSSTSTVTPTAASDETGAGDEAVTAGPEAGPGGHAHAGPSGSDDGGSASSSAPEPDPVATPAPPLTPTQVGHHSPRHGQPERRDAASDTIEIASGVPYSGHSDHEAPTTISANVGFDPVSVSALPRRSDGGHHKSAPAPAPGRGKSTTDPRQSNGRDRNDSVDPDAARIPVMVIPVPVEVPVLVPIEVPVPVFVPVPVAEPEPAPATDDDQTPEATPRPKPDRANHTGRWTVHPTPHDDAAAEDEMPATDEQTVQEPAPTPPDTFGRPADQPETEQPEAEDIPKGIYWTSDGPKVIATGTVVTPPETQEALAWLDAYQSRTQAQPPEPEAVQPEPRLAEPQQPGPETVVAELEAAEPTSTVTPPEPQPECAPEVVVPTPEPEPQPTAEAEAAELPPTETATPPVVAEDTAPDVAPPAVVEDQVGQDV